MSQSVVGFFVSFVARIQRPETEDVRKKGRKKQTTPMGMAAVLFS
jgi:hypothetical protein